MGFVCLGFFPFDYMALPLKLPSISGEWELREERIRGRHDDLKHSTYLISPRWVDAFVPRCGMEIMRGIELFTLRVPTPLFAT